MTTTSSGVSSASSWQSNSTPCIPGIIPSISAAVNETEGRVVPASKATLGPAI
ncbi:MAG: hypothetical protein HY303_12565 [Candidatus Wallbacteria bacterium]|nr:hypothetical protein [Candidatus Wallbacteria bacterium]